MKEEYKRVTIEELVYQAVMDAGMSQKKQYIVDTEIRVTVKEENEIEEKDYVIWEVEPWRIAEEFDFLSIDEQRQILEQHFNSNGGERALNLVQDYVTVKYGYNERTTNVVRQMIAYAGIQGEDVLFVHQNEQLFIAIESEKEDDAVEVGRIASWDMPEGVKEMSEQEQNEIIWKRYVYNGGARVDREIQEYWRKLIGNEA